MRFALAVSLLTSVVLLVLYVHVLLQFTKAQVECESCHKESERWRASFDSLLVDNMAMSRNLAEIAAARAAPAHQDLDDSHPMSVAEADRAETAARRQLELRDTGMRPVKVSSGDTAPRVDLWEEVDAEKDEVPDPWAQREGAE